MSTKMRNFLYGICPRSLRPYWDRVDSSPIGSRLARGVFWSIAGAVISRGLMLCATVLVARILGKTGYGEFGMIQSTVGMFGVFAGFGMGLTATKYVAEFRKSDPSRAGRIMGLSGLVAIVTGGMMTLGLFIFAPWISEHTINAPHLAGVLRISAAMLFLTALNGAQTGALAGFEAFRTIARINLSVGLISFPVLSGGAFCGGLTGAVWALTINLGFSWLLSHLALRKEARRYCVPFIFKGCSCELPIIWRFSLPAVLAGAMVGPVTWACNALLVNQPNGYAEMGIYNAVLLVKQVPEAVLAMLVAPLLPMLSEFFGKGDTDSYNKMLAYAFAMSLCIVVPVSLVQVAVPNLTLLIYGQEYLGNNNGIVQWLMLHAVLIGLFQPFGSILASMNRMWFGFIYNASWGAVFFALSYLLISRYGAVGLAAAFALTHLVASLFCVAYIYHYEKAFIVNTPIAFYTISVLFAFGICIIASHFAPPLMAGGIGCATALVLVVILLYQKKISGIRIARIITTTFDKK